MSFKKGARQFVNFTDTQENSTTALFVQNHTSPKHLLAQAQTLFLRGEIHQAHELIECIIDNNNQLVSSADLFVLHAKIYIELNGFNVHAQCCIQQALLLEPQHAEALELQNISQLHEEFRDGLYEQAQTRVRTLITSGMADPLHVYSRYLLAYNLFWKNGADSEALELLETCVQERPSFLKAWLCLAMAYKKGQAFSKAEEAFQICMDLDSDPASHDFYKNHLQSL